MSVRKKDFPCIKCDQHVKKNDKAVQCSLCDLWIHKSCENMDDGTFDVLVRQVSHNGGTFWACKSCRKYAAKFDKSIKELDRKIEDVITRVSNHDQELESIKNDISELQRVSAAASKPVDTTRIERNTRSSVFNEMSEREKRKLNVVVHGLLEADQSVTEGKKRQEEDLKLLQSLTEEIDVQLQLSDVVRFARRLGELNDKDSPRPLLVGFSNIADKNMLLDNARKLKDREVNHDNAESSIAVSIVSDLTKAQRAEERTMREEAATRNTELSADEAKNWIFKVIGKRGERRIAKMPVEIKTAPIQNASNQRITRQKARNLDN